ncbi:MAG TPA: tRNA (cytidine(34)-2'-O)-methyltransferase [Phycisphaerales bacterium]|nr:tRNA (cytidine(34)-2'-O)-methyltransferase [Phycisphaerales bacterium]
MKRGPTLHIVLHEPEIPNNTGNIGRTCVALGCALHLIHPLGFELSEKACRRAGLDYWPRLDVREHESLGAYFGTERPARLWLLTTKAARPAWDADLRAGDHLLFGRETRGLPDEVLARFPDRALSLPMVAGERSLNLATAVCAAAYEGVRQMVARGDLSIDPQGRLHPPDLAQLGRDAAE